MILERQTNKRQRTPVLTVFVGALAISSVIALLLAPITAGIASLAGVVLTFKQCWALWAATGTIVLLLEHAINPN